MTYAGEQNLKCSRDLSFVASVMHLKLQSEHKEDYLEVEESRVGTGLQAINEMMYSVEGGYCLISKVC